MARDGGGWLLLAAAAVILAGGAAVVVNNLPRGLRNNNPGNIRHGQPWQGLAEVQTDSAFATFKDMASGVRALARTLITYQEKHGLNTVRGIINRWAPPTENDTGAYVAAVAKALGVTADQAIDVRRYLIPLVYAIAKHENGATATALHLKTVDVQEGVRRALA